MLMLCRFPLRPVALAVLSILGAGTAHAGEATQARMLNGGSLHYLDTRSSVAIGIDDDGDVSGEVRHVLSSAPLSALLGEAWLQSESGGLKLMYNWMPGDAEGRPDRERAVRKAFVAYDRNAADFAKVSLGGGLEDARGGLLAYLSRGLNDSRSLGQSSDTQPSSVSGTDAGRPYLDTTLTTVTTERIERPFDWGVGLRAGRYLETSQLALNLGLDHEWGGHDASQTTLSMEAEKYFASSPWSVALRGELIDRDATGTTDDEEGRAWLLLRYGFGRIDRERSTYAVNRPAEAAQAGQASLGTAVPTLAASAVVLPTDKGQAAALAEFVTEKRLVKTTASVQTDTYFKFDSDTLSLKASDLLGSLAKDLTANGYVDSIKLTGHTCDIGAAKYNQALSERRAGSVKGFLVDKGGLPEARLVASGMGESAPRYPNTKAERSKNRRVDIEYLSYVSKEELVQVPVMPVAIAAPQIAPAPAKSVPETIAVRREEVEFEPAWIQRALLSSMAHKRTVDTYVETRTSSRSETTREYINRSPISVDDSFVVSSLSPMSLPVLDNDSDPDGDSLSLTQVGPATYGSVAISGNRVLYTPSIGGAQRSDSFSYTMSDAKGGVATGRVNLDLNINTAPLAMDDRFVVPGSGSSQLAVLSNDSDPDGDPLSILSFTQPGAGQLTLSGSELLFNPYGMFTSASFSYTISDSRGGQATANVLLIDP